MARFRYNYAKKYVIKPLKFVCLYPSEIILILHIMLFGMEKSNNVKGRVWSEQNVYCQLCPVQWYAAKGLLGAEIQLMFHLPSHMF